MGGKKSAKFDNEAVKESKNLDTFRYEKEGKGTIRI